MNRPLVLVHADIRPRARADWRYRVESSVLAVGAVHRHALIARDEADAILSPGTGMQQRASLTHTSPTPLTDTPSGAGLAALAFSTALQRQRPPARPPHRPRRLPASLTRCAMTFCVETCPVADRREHGVRVREVQLVGHAHQRLGRSAACRPAGCACASRGSARRGPPPWPRECRAPWRTTGGSCCGPCGS